MSHKAMAMAFMIWSLLMMGLGALIHHQWTKAPAELAGREVFSPQVKQSDGSVLAAKVPTPKKVMPPAPHIIPKGSKEERRITVTVKPNPPIRDPQPFLPGADGQCRLADALTCPPVTVDLSIVRNGIGRDVIASSPDGTVLTAINIPIEDGRNTFRNSLDVVVAGKDRYSAAMMRETEVLGIPIAAGAGVIRFDDETVPGLAFRASF